MRIRAKVREALTKLFGDYDLIAAPGRATVAFPIGVNFNDAYKDVRSGPSVIGSMNLLGAPGLCIPSGFGENGLPTSIQFNAAPSNEPLLLNAAIHYQLSTYHHTKKPPGFP
jgi:aspartyl-tRNA(Asn)/glutamyl-tRNA(Gln) amidotransferase subunit A